jgi:hypothetical protein
MFHGIGIGDLGNIYRLSRSPISMTMFHSGPSSTDLKLSMANFRSGSVEYINEKPENVVKLDEQPDCLFVFAP